jgi:hypothetical protein
MKLQHIDGQLSRLEELKKLEYNWDTYDSPKPSPLVIEYLTVLFTLHQRLPVCRINPVSGEEAIMVGFDNGLGVEVYSDGFVYFNEKSDAPSQEKPLHELRQFLLSNTEPVPYGYWNKA